MLDRIRPYVRPLKHAWQRRCARSLARRPGPYDDGLPRPPGFIMGCGRSGTTILGGVLTRHPGVSYLFEPYHLWAEIDPRTDVTNLHSDADGRFMLRADDWTPEAQVRFNRVMGAAGRGGQRVVEKTPHNVARIGFLDRLAPGALFVHLVRDGCDVARSIDRIASTSSYRSVDKPDYNQWWGRAEKKWHALAAEGARADYFPEEVPLLRTHAQRGAYEWLVSLAEVDRWRDTLADRLLEVRYPDLTADPAGVLSRICDFLGVQRDDAWLRSAASEIDSERRNPGDPLPLPPGMCAQFNRFQRQHGFEGCAEPSEEGSQA